MRLLPGALALLIIMPAANAADRLFPTDVLAAGEADLGLTFGYDKLEFEDPQFGASGTITETFELLELRAGLGGGLDLGASVPYFNGGEACFRFGASETCQDFDGEFGSASVFAAYRLAGDARGPFTATAKLQYDTDSAADEEDGFVAALAGGWNPGGGTRAYVELGRSMPNDDTSDKAWSLSAGLFAEAGPIQFVPEVFYSRFDANGDYSTYAGYGGGLSVFVPLGDRLTLIPGARYAEFESPDFQGFPDPTETSVWIGTLTLYALFGEASEPKKAVPRSQRRAAGKAEAPPVPATEPAPAASAPAAESAPPAAPAAPAAAPAPTALQPGPLTLARPAALYPGPRADAQPMATLEAGASVTLKLRMQNAAGTWWFVEGAGQKGWVREPDLR